MTNGQIVSRSTPTMTDLVIAVAAGAAGAYGLSRPDVSNSLPGVAIAILVVGGLMVVLLGVAPLSQVAENPYRVRTAAALIVGAAALGIGGLALNGTTIATNLFQQRAAQRVVADWIEPFPRYSTVDVAVSGDTVSVVLAGPAGADAPAAADLAEQLSSELDRTIDVDLRTRLETQETTSG